MSMSHSCVFVCVQHQWSPSTLLSQPQLLLQTLAGNLNRDCNSMLPTGLHFSIHCDTKRCTHHIHLQVPATPNPNWCPAPVSGCIGTDVGTAAPCVSYVCYVIHVPISIVEVGYDTAVATEFAASTIQLLILHLLDIIDGLQCSGTEEGVLWSTY